MGRLSPWRARPLRRRGGSRCAACAALALAAGDARADELYLAAGVILSVPIGGEARDVGVGLEVTSSWYPAENFIGPGVFVQTQYLIGGGARLDLGAQGNLGVAGAELGVTFLAPPRRPASLALHVGTYLSIGLFALSARFALAPGHAPGALRAFDLTMASKHVLEARDGALRAIDLFEGAHRP